MAQGAGMVGGEAEEESSGTEPDEDKNKKVSQTQSFV